MEKVREKVAQELKVDPRDVTMFHEGDELCDMSIGVSETVLVEGSTVEARPSRRFEARVELSRQGLTCSLEDLRDKVMKANEVASSDEEKAMVAQLMIDCDEGVDVGRPLWVAADKGFIECVRVLAPVCANVNCSFGYDGTTPLHLAAENGCEETARILLANGADPNITNTYRFTPLHEAARYGKTAVASLLLHNGADPNAEIYGGETPLNWASRWGHTDIVHLLLANGASNEANDAVPAKTESLCHVRCNPAPQETTAHGDRR
eukprot:TRINITY_DN2170_c0_g2_i1.p1 TRINITY_DN2170_c0_g2~~TRINITY_DN2170_c0_g2_i1.p1  ORF type:complete len:310 (+),score=56.32 TRINITY_DN2170_c0_g2_i1:141-932(+)